MLPVALADCNQWCWKPEPVSWLLTSLMPFTLSHPAAAWPFRKLNLVWSAFVVGSMAPDFPYITGSAEYRALGHRFPGLVEFTLPASLAALWLFHHVIKRPVIGLLPVSIQERLDGLNGDFQFGGAAHFLAIIASIVLGIATHVVWDAFTHAYTWPWYRFVWLEGWVRVPGLGRIPRYAAMQYGSSIFGVLVLCIWGLLWYRDTAPIVPPKLASRPKSRFALAVIMFAVAGIAGILRGRAAIGGAITPVNFDHFLLYFGLTALDLAFWQVLLYCVLVSSHQVW